MVVAYCLSMLGSTLLFSFVQDRQQKILFASMSVIFIPFILRVPAGVGIYWITTNLWTIAQQGIVKKTMGHHFPAVQKDEREKHAQQPRTSRNPPKETGGGGGKSKGPARSPSRRPKKRR
jgi:YidC/Oxa1 family membrane protein insertase